MATERRGRPTSLDWEALLPELITLREKGASYPALADYLGDKMGVYVASQTVRSHLSGVAEPPPPPTPVLVDEKAQKRYKTTIYKYLSEHPSASQDEIAEGTGIAKGLISGLLDAVYHENQGYYIVPPRARREHFSETEMMDALVDAYEAQGLPKGNAMSQVMYAEWREKQPAEVKRSYPSPLAYRRRYGTWGDAVEAAGLPRNERPREYDGLTKEDALVWLAHFLRDLRSEPSMVEATVPRYRAWLKDHQEAPSEELLRIKGLWGNLLVEASDLERKKRKLPAPKPVWTGGRRKNERSLPV